MTYTHPPRADLRRIHPLVDVPAAIKGASLERTAHHEAAHIVMMEWCGLTPTQATASAGRGSAEFDTTELDADEPAADHDGPLAAAQIAAIYHAGILAELIYTCLLYTSDAADEPPHRSPRSTTPASWLS